MFDKFIWKIPIRRAGIDQITNVRRRIVITQISGMIIVEMITIMAEMNIGGTTDMNQEGMTINKMTIVVMIGIIMIGSIHLKEIMVIDNHIEEVVIKTIGSLITFDVKMIIVRVIGGSMIIRSRRGLDNFSMTLGKEKIPSQTMMGVHDMKPVKQVVDRYQIATYVGQMGIT